MSRISPKLPNRKLSHLLTSLPRRATSILSQLITGHVALHTFLKKIHISESALCPRCHSPETVSHFLFYCTKFTIQCRALRAKVSIASMSMRRLLNDAKCTTHMLRYIANMKQFKDYLDVAPHSDK